MYAVCTIGSKDVCLLHGIPKYLHSTILIWASLPMDNDAQENPEITPLSTHWHLDPNSPPGDTHTKRQASPCKRLLGPLIVSTRNPLQIRPYVEARGTATSSPEKGIGQSGSTISVRTTTNSQVEITLS